jgi:pimeloyl-ACP methyl ester carboxylesterase
MTEPSFRPLPVEPEFFTWQDYRIATYRAGTGRPVLLVHSINAAASAFEMRKPFAGLSEDHAVHAIDLLGYGLSDRPARRYESEDYVAIIGAWLEQVGEPVSIVASSLGAAYAVAAAERWPAAVERLVLVAPVGLSQLADPPGPIARGVYNLLRSPLGRLVFAALTSRGGTRFFLKRQAYYDPASITPEVIAGFYDASHFPGAYYAPICFLTGWLNCDIRTAYPRLTQPIHIIWGRQAATTPVRRAVEFQNANPRTSLTVIDKASLLVQDERPQEFNAAVRRFFNAES